MLVVGGASLLCFDFASQFPEEGAKFACDGDLDLVVMELAFSQHAEAMAKASLGAPREFLNPAGGVFLSFGKLCADLWRHTVVGRLLDEDPSGMGVAALANHALPFAATTGVLGGNQPEERHELFGMLEAAEGADFRYRNHGGNELEAFEGHHGINQRFALPILEELKHGFLKAGDAVVMEVDGREVVLEHSVVCGIGQSEVA